MTDDTERQRTTDGQHDEQWEAPPARVIEGLHDATTPLATTDPATDTADLAPVGESVADAAIVGLGESTHGTREFFELKHRLLRHLVVEHGVRAFALEANLPETMALHDYVVHGEGSAREALATLHVGCWRVESVLAMVEWLRAFNADRPLDDRVACYGFAGHSTEGAVERLRDHLDTVDPDLLDEVAADLAVVEEGPGRLPGDDTTAAADVSEWVATAERVVRRLRAHLDERRAAHVDATSERAWARARRYVAVIEQVLNKTRALDASEAGARGEYDGTQYLRRMRRAGLPGATMADNVAWIREQTDVDTLVLWAHDAHLNRVSFTVPDADASAPSLGSRLAERHGDDYVAVGFSFARGRFAAMRETDDGVMELGAVPIDGPVPGTLDAALDTLDESLGVVDLRAAREAERTADWLAEPRPRFRTGGTYDADTPADQLVAYAYADAFDGLCFVAETTRARPIGEDAGDGGAEGRDTDGEAEGDTTDGSGS